MGVKFRLKPAVINFRDTLCLNSIALACIIHKHAASSVRSCGVPAQLISSHAVPAMETARQPYCWTCVQRDAGPSAKLVQGSAPWVVKMLQQSVRGLTGAYSMAGASKAPCTGLRMLMARRHASGPLLSTLPTLVNLARRSLHLRCCPQWPSNHGRRGAPISVRL